MSNTHIQDRLHNADQIPLPALGLYHCKTRVYSPTLGRFLQTDPIGYEDQVNLYAYVGNDPVNLVDPTGLAGCDASLSSKECSAAMSVQSHALQAVKQTRSSLANLKAERAEIASGDRKSLSSGARATQSALRDTFDSSTNSTIDAVDKQLAGAQTFLEDPGTAAGGSYDFRNPTATEMLNPNAASALAFVNPGFKPNSVALNWSVLSKQPGIQILATFVHEPMHVMGVVPSYIGEKYYGQAKSFARTRGGTAYSIYHNAESYACLVYPTAC